MTKYHRMECSTFLTINVMQIKTTGRFYLNYVGMAIIKRKRKQFGVRVWGRKNPPIL
jgi:hypothetical protein